MQGYRATCRRECYRGEDGCKYAGASEESASYLLYTTVIHTEYQRSLERTMSGHLALGNSIVSQSK